MTMQYDIIFRNGTIFDGSGKKPWLGDVAVRDGKIAEIAPSIKSEAIKIVDA